MQSTLRLLTAVAVVCSLASAKQSIASPLRSGLAETPAADNQALIVGAPNGLPGIDTDLDNAQAMVANPYYNFQTTRLYDGQASKSALLKNLKSVSSQVAGNGTFFFYFSGHGNRGIIAADSFEIVSIKEIRQAIENGRGSQGPLARLILIFDSCNAGSLLDPMKGLRAPLTALLPEPLSNDFANAVVGEFAAQKRAAYWQKLFVFASSTADEESEAGANGSLFTEGLRKAYDTLAPQNGTVGELISQTQAYTGSAQHPVARLVPTSLSAEKLHD